MTNCCEDICCVLSGSRLEIILLFHLLFGQVEGIDVNLYFFLTSYLLYFVFLIEPLTTNKLLVSRGSSLAWIREVELYRGA